MKETDIRTSNPDPDVTMGGQAVIEGVMMRGPRSYAVAVRRPQGDIAMISHPFIPVVRRKRWLGFPIVRGAVSLIEMLLLGYRALDYSANVAEAGAAKTPEDDTAADDTPQALADAAPERAISRWAMAGVFVTSMALAMLLFVALPNVATHLIGKVAFSESAMATDSPLPLDRISEAPPAPVRSGLVEEQRPILYNLVSGALRLLVIVSYIWLISLMKDVRRLFQYHGAEHKVVMAYEKGLPLDIEHARRMTTLHPRCGTTFIAIVIFVSIFVFAILAAVLVRVYPGFHDWSIWLRKPFLIGLHILFMPFVAGLAYEITRRAGRRPDFPVYRILLWPGFAFQRITTREPDDTMLEVALTAFREALEPQQISQAN